MNELVMFLELKAVQAQKKGLRRPVTELKNGTHCFDESGRSAILRSDAVNSFYKVTRFENDRICTGKKVPKLPNANKDMKTNGLKKSDTLSTIPGKVLNRYSIGQVIGEGNFAVVRRCSDRYVTHAFDEQADSKPSSSTNIFAYYFQT